MTAKEYYRSYLADDKVSPIAEAMMTAINQERCVHAFEFGMGTGKHLRRLNAKGISTFGIDISLLNCFTAQAQSMGFAYGDETYLRHFCNMDAVFTVSVLDHIEYIDDIVQELKRIANKIVYLIETNDTPGEFYYPHDYQSLGFTKSTNVEWKSDGDGAMYYLWRWDKKDENIDFANDDKG